MTMVFHQGTPPALRATSPYQWRLRSKASLFLSLSCKGRCPAGTEGFLFLSSQAPFSVIASEARQKRERAYLIPLVLDTLGKTGHASIYACRFEASSEHKHPHLLRRMFYEHGAKRGNLKRMQTANNRLLRLSVPRNDARVGRQQIVSPLRSPKVTQEEADKGLLCYSVPCV